MEEALASGKPLYLSIWIDSLTMAGGRPIVAAMTAAPTDTGRRYKGADPAARMAERRARLLDAGLALFGTRGYAATTLAMLSAESGVPHRYLTQVFPDKEALLRELYVIVVEDALAAVRAARQGPATDPVGRIRRDVAAACQAFMADERRLRINCLEVVGVSPAMEALRREYIRAFGRLILDDIETLVAGGVLPPRDDYFYGTLGLVGAFHELMTEWVLTPALQRPAAAVVVRQVQEFFRGMLLAVLTPVPEQAPRAGQDGPGAGRGSK